MPARTSDDDVVIGLQGHRCRGGDAVHEGPTEHRANLAAEDLVVWRHALTRRIGTQVGQGALLSERYTRSASGHEDIIFELQDIDEETESGVVVADHQRHEIEVCHRVSDYSAPRGCRKGPQRRFGVVAGAGAWVTGARIEHTTPPMPAVKPRAVSERAIREEQAQPPQFRVALPSVTATGKGMAWAGWANADRPMPPSKYGG